MRLHAERVRRVARETRLQERFAAAHPGVRMLSAHAHLVPHMVTLARMRPNPVRDWRVRAPVSATLVDAMVASVDDPVFDGPHIN